MANTATPGLIASLGELTPAYSALLCDAWGVMHDGVRANAAASAALVRFRQQGGRVVVMTNAPRPKSEVVALFDRLGVPRAAYDDIVTSGDTARDVLAARPGVRLYHVGPERDLPLYFGLPVVFAGEADCDIVCCTGLFNDDTETPDDYEENFAAWRARNVPMLCANPDIVVERGERLIWCAGALAERYRALGGETTVVGKPYAAIYGTAFARLAGLAGAPVPKSAVLAIGDGAATDIRGAFDQEIDALFVTGGIHAGDFGSRDAPDIAAVRRFLAEAGLGARAVASRLEWP